MCLVGRHADLDVFDAVFGAAFDATIGADPHARRRGLDAGAGPRDEGAYVSVPRANTGGTERGGGAAWLSVPAVVSVDDTEADPEHDQAVPDLVPAVLAADALTPLPALDAERLVQLERWLAAEMAQWPRRRSRRTVPHRSGHRVALRETMTEARRTGWEPVHLVGRRPRLRPRPVVVVCDVSRSMRGYSEAYLHFMRAATTVTGAEAYAFSTRLTRLTPALRATTPAAAIARATADLDDRYGGTRIAGSLATLLRSHHGNELRGAVVVVASDGWDGDDPEDLAAAMARIARRAHRVVWLNPRAAAPGYRPLVGGMAAALPFCDDLLPAHTPLAMLDVVRAISSTR